MASPGAKNGGSAEALDLASTVPVRAALLTATVRKIAGRGLWDGRFLSASADGSMVTW